MIPIPTIPVIISIEPFVIICDLPEDFVKETLGR
jgi:hypothetical protein